MLNCKWAYGVTTVPARREELLPRTLASLAAGGFDNPRLFVDGGMAGSLNWDKVKGSLYNVSQRMPPVRAYGNWLLALMELFIREPEADRYAIFQDDIVCVKNLRQYLSCCRTPENTYLNLYTHPRNESDAKGWHEGVFLNTDGGSGPPGFQKGLGALGLVFSNRAVTTLLASPHMVERPKDLDRGWRNIDGAVVTAMNKAGWREVVHMPSLIWHTGKISTISNKSHAKEALSFPGEDFDAMSFLEMAVL